MVTQRLLRKISVKPDTIKARAAIKSWHWLIPFDLDDKVEWKLQKHARQFWQNQEFYLLTEKKTRIWHCQADTNRIWRLQRIAVYSHEQRERIGYYTRTQTNQLAYLSRNEQRLLNLQENIDQVHP